VVPIQALVQYFACYPLVIALGADVLSSRRRISDGLILGEKPSVSRFYKLINFKKASKLLKIKGFKHSINTITLLIHVHLIYH
jgi:hypothetical protein